jgi:hypothetical protein
MCSIGDCEGKVVARGWCHKHYRRWLSTGDPTKVRNGRGLSLEDKFWRFVDIRPDHWLWTGKIAKNGYGHFAWRESGKIITVGAHIFAYRLLVGPIPEDRPHLDHVVERCGRKDCCWPAHLEPVTPAENNRRHYRQLTQCSNGHPYTLENTRIVKGTQRVCRQCGRDRNRKHYQAHH